MAEGNSIKDEVKEQRKKFLTLTFTGKLQYIWEYYRIPIAAVIAVVLVVLSFINAYRRNNYEGVCDIAVCDGKITGYDTDDDLLTCSPIAVSLTFNILAKSLMTSFLFFI